MVTWTGPNLGWAFLITLLAGLATGIGSAIAFFARRTNYRFLSVATGLSGGVMLYVSFLEIVPKAERWIEKDWDENPAAWMVTGGFFLGMIAMLLIDRLIPSDENPHETRERTDLDRLHPAPERGASAAVSGASLHRMGLFTALAIGIHNFPEGLATFMAALESPRLGLAIGVAVALHNIPEGISVSVPIYYASGDRRRAFVYSLISGLAEPIGAVVGFLLLRPFLTPTLMGLVFASVAGIMVYISLDELLPTSRAYGKGHDSLYGLLAGMAVMALSLLLMR